MIMQNKSALKLIDYVKENLGAGFVLLYMALLAVSTLCLIVNIEAVAERLANLGFGFLIVGVLLKIVQLMKYSKNDDKTE